MKGWTVGYISECKRNMLQFQGSISDAKWKGFHGAQLKEKVERKERDLRFLKHFKKIS